MPNQFYKVRCRHDGFSGRIGRFDFKNGLSLWLRKKFADHALAVGAAQVTHGPTYPYWGAMTWEGNPAWCDEQTSIATRGKWDTPPGCAVTAPDTIDKPVVPEVVPEVVVEAPKVESKRKPKKGAVT